jgi:hypothetical protein
MCLPEHDGRGILVCSGPARPSVALDEWIASGNICVNKLFLIGSVQIAMSQGADHSEMRVLRAMSN